MANEVLVDKAYSLGVYRSTNADDLIDAALVGKAYALAVYRNTSANIHVDAVLVDKFYTLAAYRYEESPPVTSKPRRSMSIMIPSYGVVPAAPPLDDLIIDTASYPPPGAALPAFQTATPDPTFNVPIYRITDPGQPVGGTGATFGTRTHHQYMRFPAWNADETILFLETNADGLGSGGLTFLDGSPPFNGLYHHSAPAGFYQARWDRVDPSRMIYHTDTELYYFDVVSGTPTLIRDFGGTYSGMTFGLTEGDTSWDGDYVPFLATRTSDGDTVAFAYRISDDTIMGNISITDLSPKVITEGMVHVSPEGNYLLLYFDDETQAVYTINGVLVDNWPEVGIPNHASLTVDNNGDEVVVGRNASGDLIKRRLSDGAITVLNDVGSFIYHTGGSNYLNPLWVACDTWDDSGAPYVGEILIVALDGSGITGRICHHYPGTGVPLDYDAEPHASPSPLGNYIVFASAWGEADDRPVNTFVADISGFQLPGVG